MSAASVAFNEVWSTTDRLDRLAASRRFRIQAEADETAWLAALAADPDPYGDGGVLDKDWIVEDIAVSLQVSSVVAAAKLHIAEQLATRFPATFTALLAHRFELRYATRLVESAQDLPDALIAEVEAQVLGDVETQTITQFTAKVRRVVAKADPRSAENKRKADLAARRVVFTPVENGMTELWALLPADSSAKH